jgi:hypothetical protein
MIGELLPTGNSAPGHRLSGAPRPRARSLSPGRSGLGGLSPGVRVAQLSGRLAPAPVRERASHSVTLTRPHWTTDENQGWPSRLSSGFCGDFGRWIGRGSLVEGLRSASVRPVGRRRPRSGVIWAGFARAWSPSGGRRRGRGARLSCGREPRTSQRAGVWSSRACRATLPFEGLIYARSAVTLAPTSLGAAGVVFSGAAGLVLAGLAACQSETIRV